MDYLLEFVNALGRHETRLNRDIRAQEVIEGANRHKFLEALSACGEGNWQELHDKATTPDAIGRDLVKDIREAMAPLCTPTLRKADPAFSKLAETRLQLVKEIGTIRRKGGEVDIMKNRLEAIQKQLKKASRQWNFWKRKVALEELTEAHRRNETAVAYRICRRIAPTSTGKGKIYFNRPPPPKPSRSEWSSALMREGPRGGMAATEIDYEQAVAGIAEEQALRAKDMNDVVKAQGDWNGMKNTIMKQALRKAFPPWDLPTEVWRLVLRPARIARGSLKQGLGCGKLPSIHKLQARVASILEVSRRQTGTPTDWHRSWGYGLDKSNNKAMCDSLRLIHILSPFGRAWYHQSLLKGPPVEWNYFDHGGLPHRTRENAIMVQLITSYVLRRAGISHCTSLYDSANEFPSTSRTALATTTRAMDHPDGIIFHMQRLENTAIALQCRDGVLTVLPRSGECMGDHGPPKKFIHATTIPMKEFEEQMLEQPGGKDLLTVNPVSGKGVNLAITKFVDDVAMKTMQPNLKTGIVQASDAFDEALCATGHQQNRAKQVHVPVCCGKGADKVTRSIFAADSGIHGEVVTHARYLGPQISANTTFSAEKANRIAAARTGWLSMGKFWAARGVPLFYKRLVFICRVQNAALSGLTAYVLKQLSNKILTPACSSMPKLSLAE